MKKTIQIISILIFVSISSILVSCGSPQTEDIKIIPSPTAEYQFDSDGEIPTVQTLNLMEALTWGDPASSQDALDTIRATQDVRYIPVFIELLRVRQIGVLNITHFQEMISVLEEISGQTFGNDWFAWVEWYGKTDLTPPPGFTGWKGELLGAIDPGFEKFLQEDYPSTIRTEEIVWGGVMVDGIPALDNPVMISPEEADYLTAEEPVFGISINGDHRAYPLRILDWHEMANDVVGGVPVSLAYCTLCGAGIAYDGRVSGDETYTFGSSGFLFRSNKLMYDRQTRSLWNQFTGKPVLGELVDGDIQLQLLPVVTTSWSAWLAQHPDTKVLDINTGYQRPYTPGAAYGEYFAFDGTMFPVWQRNDLLPNKERVFTLQIEGIPNAYPVEMLIKEVVVNDVIGETNLVLIAPRGDIIVEGNDIWSGEVSYNAGGEVRAFDRSQEIFSPGLSPETVIDSEVQTWEVTEEALISPTGETAPRVSGHLAYWFGWFTFFPQTLLYGE
jgi:hypothetical protein